MYAILPCWVELVSRCGRDEVHNSVAKVKDALIAFMAVHSRRQRFLFIIHVVLRHEGTRVFYKPPNDRMRARDPLANAII